MGHLVCHDVSNKKDILVSGEQFVEFVLPDVVIAEKINKDKETVDLPAKRRDVCAVENFQERWPATVSEGKKEPTAYVSSPSRLCSSSDLMLDRQSFDKWPSLSSGSSAPQLQRNATRKTFRTHKEVPLRMSLDLWGKSLRESESLEKTSRVS